MVPTNGMDKMKVVSVIRDTREKSVKHVSVKTFYKNQFKVRSLVIQIPDQDKTSPYNIKQTSDGNKEKFLRGEYYLIQFRILRTNTIRIFMAGSKRITNEIWKRNGSANLEKKFKFKNPSRFQAAHSKTFLNSQMQFFKPAFCFPITTQQIYLVQPQVRLQFRLKVLSSLDQCEVII